MSTANSYYLKKNIYKLKSAFDIEYLRRRYLFLLFHFLGNQNHKNNQRKSHLQQETWRSQLQIYITFLTTKHYKKQRTQNIPRKSTIVESNFFSQNCKIFRSLKLKTQNTKEKKKDFGKKQQSFNVGCRFAFLCSEFDVAEANIMQKRPSCKGCA